jgi:hypothetical protein
MTGVIYSQLKDIAIYSLIAICQISNNNIFVLLPNIRTIGPKNINLFIGGKNSIENKVEQKA